MVESIIRRERTEPARGYAIHTPDGNGPWVPEQGKFYNYVLADGTKFRVMMRGDIAYVEQTLPDGAVCYYEVNEAGDVKQCKLPYPLETYRVEIPPAMIINQTSRRFAPALTETTYILKWGRSVRIVTDSTGRLAEADLKGRYVVSHWDRVFRIMEPPK